MPSLRITLLCIRCHRRPRFWVSLTAPRWPAICTRCGGQLVELYPLQRKAQVP